MFVQLSLYTFISFSWLLRNRDSEIRSLSSPYLRAVDRYLSNLLPLLVPLQVITGRLLCKKEDGNLTSFTVNLSWSIVNMFLSSIDSLSIFNKNDVSKTFGTIII